MACNTLFVVAAHAEESTTTETATAPELPGLQIGDELPNTALDLHLLDLDGNSVALDGLRGEQGTLLLFSANTCPYVLDWLDRLPQLAQLARAEDMAFVLVNSNARKRKDLDSPENMLALSQAHAFDFPYWIDQDSRLAEALGATRTPEAFLFDSDSQLVYRGAIDDHSGPQDQVSQHWLLQALRETAADLDLQTSLTAPLGCAILKPRRRRPR